MRVLERRCMCIFLMSQKLWYYMHTTLLFFCTKFERDQRLVNLLLLFFFARVNELGSLGEWWWNCMHIDCCCKPMQIFFDPIRDFCFPYMSKLWAPQGSCQMLIYRFCCENLLATPSPTYFVILIFKAMCKNFLNHPHPRFKEQRWQPATEVEVTIFFLTHQAQLCFFFHNTNHKG